MNKTHSVWTGDFSSQHAGPYVVGELVKINDFSVFYSYI